MDPTSYHALPGPRSVRSWWYCHKYTCWFGACGLAVASILLIVICTNTLMPPVPPPAVHEFGAVGWLQVRSNLSHVSPDIIRFHAPSNTMLYYLTCFDGYISEETASPVNNAAPPEALESLAMQGIGGLSLASPGVIAGGERNAEYLPIYIANTHEGFLMDVGSGYETSNAAHRASKESRVRYDSTVAIMGIISAPLPEAARAAQSRFGLNLLTLVKGAPNVTDADRILDAIRTARTRVGMLVILQWNSYWDATSSVPTWYVEWADQVVQAGASAFIGYSNVPIIRGVKLSLNGSPIFFSLGDLYAEGDIIPQQAEDDGRHGFAVHFKFIAGLFHSARVSGFEVNRSTGIPVETRRTRRLEIMDQLAELSHQQFGTRMYVDRNTGVANVAGVGFH